VRDALGRSRHRPGLTGLGVPLQPCGLLLVRVLAEQHVLDAFHEQQEREQEERDQEREQGHGLPPDVGAVGRLLDGRAGPERCGTSAHPALPGRWTGTSSDGVPPIRPP
jgi:hypothetical protein